MTSNLETNFPFPFPFRDATQRVPRLPFAFLGLLLSGSYILSGCGGGQDRTQGTSAGDVGGAVAPSSGEGSSASASASTRTDEGPGGDSVGAAHADGVAGAARGAARAVYPVIRTVGEEGVAPSRVVVEFSEAVVDQADAPLGGTRLTFSPEVEGILRFAGPSTLEFVPRTGFLAGADYRVTLEAVETKRGVAQAGSSDWAYTFSTPAFALVRANIKSVDLKRKRVEVDLVYSAPVEVTSIGRFGTWTIGGSPARRVTYEKTDRLNIARATLSYPKLTHGLELRFDQDPGVEANAASGSSTGVPAVAPAGFAVVSIPQGKPVEILASGLREGGQGFYVQVVCRDRAAGDESMYYWDSQSGDSYQVSPRCVLEESDARESIHFTPEVKWSLTPTRGGFRILGDFKRGSYALRIDADARSVDGGALAADYLASFSVPARSPDIGFLAQGRYLPRSAWQSLGVRHRNVSEVQLRVRRIPPENLAFWMSGDQETADDRNSTLILDRTLKVSGKPDVLTTSWFPVADLLPEMGRGVLQLELSIPSKSVRSRLLMTDLNLVAKRQAGDNVVGVFVIDIHKNRPVTGSRVKLIARSGRAISRCATDLLGYCALAGLDPKAVDKSAPFAIIATLGEDLTYLPFDTLEIRADESSTEGVPYASADPKTPYQAALYTDRGVYRPGDVAHVVAVLRNRADVAPKMGMPVELQIIDPRGKVAKKYALTTNEAGLVNADVEFEAFADTGHYGVAVQVADARIGYDTLNVEAFVPERMKVEVQPLADPVLLSASSGFEVSAEYLFGGSAEGSRVEMSCRLESDRFRPKKNGEFAYGVWHEHAPAAIPLGSVNGVLDARGLATLECPTLSARGGFGSTARVVADVSVFESGGGRSTVGRASALVHPAQFYLGVAASTDHPNPGDRVQVKGVVVDWNGELSPASVKEVKVEFLRVEQEHDWIYERESGAWNYREFSRLSSEGAQTVKVSGGRFSADIQVGAAATAYVVRAMADGVQSDLTLEGEAGYAWWYSESEQDKTPRPLKPTPIELKLPEAVELNQDATLSFDAPFSGRALVTIETDRVLRKEWLDIVPGPVKWSFSLDAFVPNAYVSVFCLKDPHADSPESFVPHRAFGVRSVRVVPKPFLRELTLTVPEVSRSQSKLEIELATPAPLDEPTFVTVAAVDEGILSLTRFQSPNPLEDLFKKRGLGVATFETIGWNMLLPAGGTSSHPGGSGPPEGFGRAQPVKPVALWSGVLRVPESGKLRVSLDIPEYRGRLRVMAVAVGKKRIGVASKAVTVRDPIIVQATLPRFMVYGDRMQVPVSITNASGAKRKLEVAMTVKPLALGGSLPKEDKDKDKGEGESERAGDPMISFLDANKRVLELEDGKSTTAVFTLKANRAVGAATVRVETSVKGFKDGESGESVEVPFVPSTPATRRVKILELKTGRIALKPHLSGWLPTTERTTFWVTSNPYGQAFDHLKYLVRYPYGCIEQTTSSARPLLYVGRFVGNIDPSLIAKGGIESMVQAGISRVFSMQTPSGGFAYWPGGNEPSFWASAYATHFLLDAKKLNYAVPEARLNDAIDWLGEMLDRRPADWSEYDYRMGEPYAHYVLAVAGRGRKARMQSLIASIAARSRAQAFAMSEGEARESLNLLKAGLFLAGDRRYEQDLRSPDLSPVTNDRKNGWSFYSDRRRRGLALSLYADLFGNDPAGEPLARLVADGLQAQSSGWYTTQELVWGITGLGKYLGEVTKAFPAPSLEIDGRKISAIESASKGSDRSWSIERASEYGSVDVVIEKGSTEEGRVFLVMSSEGVPADGRYPTGGEGLTIAREYRSATGEVIADDALKLADLVYVVVNFSNKTGERIQNLAVVDRFPAGFEIENPRLGRGGEIDWIPRENLFSPDHMNLRDDRVEYFGSLDPGESKTLVYAVRAVTAGVFTVPPVEIEAMYDPSRWARARGGRATIHGPWQDNAESK
ncbi:MAG: hypothetical protein H6729_17135 [Deltaproteobacteria bacterium]|nr:hypothetical protein [Deltaproteobacteria bacterium]